jgi:Xaa-Pro aminopeptidase
MQKLPDCFKKRQQKLLSQMKENSIAIIFATKEPKHHRKTIYPYRQDSKFYYMTGFAESDAIAVFLHGHDKGRYILFSKEKNYDTEVWTGKIVGQIEACDYYGADQAFTLNQAEVMIPELISGHNSIYFNIEDHEDNEMIMHWVKKLADKNRAGINPPEELISIDQIINEMRNAKDEYELNVMRKSVDIASAAHIRAMQKCKPGMMEYELEAEILYEFVRNGGRTPSFETIIASGANGCVLHYTQNNSVLKDGDMVIVDAGVEYNFYASDISRSYPVNGKFTKEQQAIYEIVLNTQLEVIKNVKPGVSWETFQELALKTLTQGLVDIKILSGNVNDLVADKAYKPFYMHLIGHWLGIDVKDPAKYKLGDEWRKLEPGMIFTVEPGLYISANTPGVDPKWWNIAVRIEDDVLVTATGYEVLSAKVPKSVVDIEKMRK